MDLGLSIADVEPKKPLAEFGRELVEADLKALETKAVAPKLKSALQRFTNRHRRIAQLSADARSPSDIAAIVGMSVNRVYILLQDPMMLEMISVYQKMKDEQYIGMHENLADIGSDAIEILRERMEEEPHKLTTAMLLEIVTKTADRTGFGPATSNTNLNVNLDLAQRMKDARLRANNTRQIELEAKEILAPQESDDDE